jgi:hypothetical protein
MTARDTYQASVQSAVTKQIASINSAHTVFQETVNASGVNVGYTLQSGNYGNFAAAVKNANTARIAALQAAEHAKQVAINAARDTLKNSGDNGPA